MKTIEARGKIFYQFEQLDLPGLFHFSSTRQGWGGNGKARFTGDQLSDFQPFREELANALKIQTNQFVFPRQVHGNKVEIITELTVPGDMIDTDALITNRLNICVCVQTADCVPILLYDPVKRVVAAIHAGWKGTVSKIVSKTLYEMQRHFDTDPEDVIAGIGPSIHMHVYEVGEDVIHAVRDGFDNYRDLLKPSMKEGKAYFDLWKANKSLLVDAGIPNEQIEIMGFCSYSHEALFFSARRDGANTGRMVSGMMLQ